MFRAGVAMRERSAELGGERAQPARSARHRGAGQPAAGSGPVVTGAATFRVLVADDQPLFQQGIGALIRDSPETELPGEAASGEEAVARCAQLEPDVVVMDVHMTAAWAASRRPGRSCGRDRRPPS
jgi:PleD family two-component response regulator